MKLINLTPHTINIFDKDGKKEIVVIQPKGLLARHNDNETFESDIDFEGSEIPSYKANLPTTKGLPAPKDKVIYIVSAPVRLVNSNRNDLASPGELIRNKEGQPIGCKGLIFNSAFFDNLNLKSPH